MAPLLENLLYHGSFSGLWFVTLPTDATVEGEKYKYIRVLLLSPSGRKMAKCLEASTKLHDGTGLPDLGKETISRAFGELYGVAASHINECAAFGPQDFLGHVKDMFPWAATIPADTLWAFTYRCFHAREIFKDVKPGWRKSPVQPLVEGLDEFRRKFSERYPVQYGLEYLSLPAEQRDTEKSGKIMAIRAGHLALHRTSFPQQLTCAEYDGDGTDRKFWHFQPGYQDYYRVPSAHGPAQDEDRARTSAQQAIAQGLMNEDGDVNPGWEGEEELDDEAEEAYEDMEDQGEGEGGEDVEMGEVIAENTVTFSNLAFRPAPTRTR